MGQRIIIIINVKGSPWKLEWDNASVRRELTYWYLLLPRIQHTGKKLVDADWRVFYSKMTLAESCWFYSKWVNICWILWISRVSEGWKEVRLSEEIPGIRRYRQVGTVTSDV